MFYAFSRALKLKFKARPDSIHLPSHFRFLILETIRWPRILSAESSVRNEEHVHSTFHLGEFSSSTFSLSTIFKDTGFVFSPSPRIKFPRKVGGRLLHLVTYSSPTILPPSHPFYTLFTLSDEFFKSPSFSVFNSYTFIKSDPGFQKKDQFRVPLIKLHPSLPLHLDEYFRPFEIRFPVWKDASNPARRVRTLIPFVVVTIEFEEKREKALSLSLE